MRDEAEAKFIAWFCLFATFAVPGYWLASTLCGSISPAAILKGQSHFPIGWLIVFVLVEAVGLGLAGYFWKGRKWDWLSERGEINEAHISRRVNTVASGSVRERMNLPEDRLVLGISKGNKWIVTADKAYSVLVMAPSQRGKTSGVLFPNMAQWPRALIATSSKEEIVRKLARRRLALGTGYLFDPFHMVKNTRGLIRVNYNPVTGADRWDEATKTGAAMTVDNAKGVTDGSHWRLRAGQIVAALLHACAHSDSPYPSTASDWLATQDFSKAQGILDRYGYPAAAKQLSSMKRIPGSELGSIISSASGSLAAYSMEVIRESEKLDQPFDPIKFLSGNNTLFITVPTNYKKVGAPIVLGFLNAIDEAVLEVSNDNDGKLPVPLFYCIDELLNLAPFSADVLSELLSERPGRLVKYMLAIQDWDAAVEKYGEKFTNSLRTLCQALVATGGVKSHVVSSIADDSGANAVAAHKAATPGKALPKHLQRGDRLTVTEIQELHESKVYVMQGSKPPEVAKLMSYWKTKPFKSWIDDAQEHKFTHRMKAKWVQITQFGQVPNEQDSEDGYQYEEVGGSAIPGGGNANQSKNSSALRNRVVGYTKHSKTQASEGQDGVGNAMEYETSNNGSIGIQGKLQGNLDDTSNRSRLDLIVEELGIFKGYNDYKATCFECKQSIPEKQGFRRLTKSKELRYRHKSCDAKAEIDLENISAGLGVAAAPVPPTAPGALQE